MEAVREPGDFHWIRHRDGTRELYLCTPDRLNGKKVMAAWPISPRTVKASDGSEHTWTCDGPDDAPTLHPSLHHKVRFESGERTIWHGWVEAGVLREC